MTEQMVAASAKAGDDGGVLKESHERQKNGGQPLRLAVIGQTGSGKSSLGNLMLGTKVFDESKGFSSCTVKCNGASGVVEGRRVTIVDSPGTMDTKDPQAALRELVNAIKLSPEGFHAFFIIVNATVKYTDEEHRAVQALRQIFGDRLFEFSIVVFTHGDVFDNDEDKLKEALQQSRRENAALDELLTWCNDRVVLIENDGRLCDPQEQRRQIVSLLEKIEDLVSKNGGLYTDRIFQTALQERKKKEEEEKRRQRESERERKKEENQNMARQHAEEREKEDANLLEKVASIIISAIQKAGPIAGYRIGQNFGPTGAFVGAFIGGIAGFAAEAGIKEVKNNSECAIL